MRIAVLGAARVPGIGLVEAAEARGIHVVSAVEDPSFLPGDGPIIIKPYSELELSDLAGCHVVVDAVSFPRIAEYPEDKLPLWHLLEILRGSGIPLLCVGSAACLYTGEDRSEGMLESSCLCDDERDASFRLAAAASKRLKAESEVAWTLLCPPLIFDPDGYKSGRIEFFSEVLPMGVDGSSYISGPDLALAAVELLLRGLKSHETVAVRGAMITA